VPDLLEVLKRVQDNNLVVIPNLFRNPMKAKDPETSSG